MNANDMLVKYCIDESHLPNQTGPNIVQIVSVDTDYYTVQEKGRKIEKPRHQLWLSGFDLPLRLGNMRIKILIERFGAETEHWIGKKISLFVGQEIKFGKMEVSLMIDVRPVDQSLPIVSQRRAHHQTSGSSKASPVPADMKSLGVDSAAEVCCLLEERGKTWEDLRLHLISAGFGEAIAGKLPADCPDVIRTPVQTYLRSFPKCAAKPTREKFIAMWRPPPAAQEAVDKTTGEVINPAAGLPGQQPVKVAEDDIPF